MATTSGTLSAERRVVVEKEEILKLINQRKEFLEELQIMQDKNGIEIDLEIGIRLDEINAILNLFEMQ